MVNQSLAVGVNVQERTEFREAMMEYRSTHSISATVTHFGVSKSFVCKWQKRYRIDPSDLQDHSKRPRNCAYAYTEEEREALKSSFLIDNEESRKRNKLAPTIYRNSTMLMNRSYSSIKRIAKILIGQCKRSGILKAKKKVITGRSSATATNAGEIVQVDMKCVPSKSIVQLYVSDELRKEGLIQAARQRMDNTLIELIEQERAFPGLPIIKYLHKESVREYADYVGAIQNAALEPEKELKLYQYTAVDSMTKWSFRWMFSEHSELASLRFAIELLKGAPFKIQCIQTDNGSEFVSDYMKGHGCHTTYFQEFLASNDILHSRIAKGSPWENGYVEAQHRIDQERLYDTMKVSSLEDGMAVLAAYQSESNLYPKPCLGMKSPIDMISEAI